MSLPSEVEFLGWVVGSEWPEADEDALRRCCAAWTAATARLRELAGEAGLAAVAVRVAVDGDIRARFDEIWAKFSSDGGHLDTLADICAELATACERAATEVEYAKYLFIAALVALAIQIAILTASIAGTFGASAAGIPVAVAATQLTVRVIAMRLVQAIVLSAASNVAIDAAAQLAQLVRGTRDRWDLATTGRSATDGAVVGALAGGVLLAGGRLAPGLVSTGYGRLGAAGFAGALGGAVAPLVHGDLPAGTDLLMALTSGIAGGLGPDLVRAGGLGPDMVGLGPDMARSPARSPDHPRPDELAQAGFPLRTDDLARTENRAGVEATRAQVDGAAPVNPAGRIDQLQPVDRLGQLDSPSPAHRPGQAHVRPVDGLGRPDVVDPVHWLGRRPDVVGPVDRLGPAHVPGPVEPVAPVVAAAPADPAAPVDSASVVERDEAAGSGLDPTPGPGQRGPTRDWAPERRAELAAAPHLTGAGWDRLTGRSMAGEGGQSPDPSPSQHERHRGSARQHVDFGTPIHGGAGAEQTTQGSPGAVPAWDRPAETAATAESEHRGLSAYPDRPLTDAEATELARATLLRTDAGLAFYRAGDELRDFAAAIRPTDGYLTIDLHGGPDGFEIDGRLVPPAQFATVLRRLGEAGVFDLPTGMGIKLLSCDTAAGGPDSPAAQLARLLDVVVIAPDRPVWTGLDGEEIVASATLVDGRWLPADPPDGEWKAFAPSGQSMRLPSDLAGLLRSSGPDRHDRWSHAQPRGPGPALSWAHGDWLIGPDPRPAPADELRGHRDRMRAELIDTGQSVSQLVHTATRLDELFDLGVRPADIVAHLDDTTLARLATHLSPGKRTMLAGFLGDQRVQTALQRGWDETTGSGRVIVAESLLRHLVDSTDLVEVMTKSDTLMQSLCHRPATMDNLMRHPRAIMVLREVVQEIQQRGVAAILADPPTPGRGVPLAPWQRAVSASLASDREIPRQPGFEVARADQPGYLDHYLRELYSDARLAQIELDRIATDLAAETTGVPGWRTEPKKWQRVIDKLRGNGSDPTRVHDLAAAKVQYESLADLYRGLARLRDRYGVVVAGFDDRFANPRPSGYRDVQVKVRTGNGHVGELQLRLRAIDEVAVWEHVLFEVTRDFSTVDRSGAAGRSPAGERTAIERLINLVQMREFDRALRSGLDGPAPAGRLMEDA